MSDASQETQGFPLSDCGGDHFCLTVGGKCDTCIEADTVASVSLTLAQAQLIHRVLQEQARGGQHIYDDLAIETIVDAIAKAEGRDAL